MSNARFRYKEHHPERLEQTIKSVKGLNATRDYITRHHGLKINLAVCYLTI